MLMIATGAGCLAMPPRAPEPVEEPDLSAVSGKMVPAPNEEPAPQGEPEAAAVAPAPPLDLTLDEALLKALDNNRSLRIARIRPAQRRESETEAEAAFDPVWTGELAESRRHAVRPGMPGADEEGTSIGLALRGTRPSGARWELGLDTERIGQEEADDRHAARAGVAVTQPLRRGAGRTVTLVEIEQARLDTRLSEYELQAVAETLVAQIEAVYLDSVLARRRQEIVEASLRLAERQQEETRQRIRVGGLPATELAAAEAEVAVRREALINARSQEETLRIRLARLVEPERLAHADPRVTVQEEPPPEDAAVEPVESHLAFAVRARADLNQARLLAQRGDLDLVRTANGLLPRMDLFVRLGKSGYADSFGGSFEEMGGDAYDAALGLAFEWPAGNRAARARHRRARLTREQTEESLRNTEDLVREDVHVAWLEVRRARQQAAATAATRALQEEKLRAENAKFAAGQSTAIVVAQTQRDLLVAQVAEAEAAIRYRKARTDLYRLDGSLLDRRGIRLASRER